MMIATALPLMPAEAQTRDRAARLDRIDRARTGRQSAIDRTRTSDRTRDRVRDDPPAPERSAGDTEEGATDAARTPQRNQAVLYLADRGYSVRRGEILALNISDKALRAAKHEGMRVTRQRELGADNILTVLYSGAFDNPDGAIARLKQIDPSGIFTTNHVYQAQGEADAGSDESMPQASPPLAMSARRVGMIDGRVDLAHPMLAGFQGEAENFTPGEARPSRHGMAVALRLADVLNARAPELPISLYAASVMTGEESRWAAADALSEAIVWQTENEAEILNISLAGPPNPIVEAVLGQYQARGGVVVAAVGNGGPLSMEIYPAAYAGVIGVSAIDGAGEIYPYATRGSHVDIAAPGVDIKIAGLEPDSLFSGTSFAAPYISAYLLITGQTEAALQVMSADLGPAGRDDIYGWGAIILTDNAPVLVAADQ